MSIAAVVVVLAAVRGAENTSLTRAAAMAIVVAGRELRANCAMIDDVSIVERCRCRSIIHYQSVLVAVYPEGDVVVYLALNRFHRRHHHRHIMHYMNHRHRKYKKSST